MDGKFDKQLIAQSRPLIISRELSIAEIAAKLYVSEVHLRNTYHRCYGLSPRRYAKQVNMKRAQTLLRTTDDTISTIAATLGYANVSKFSAAYRRFFGESPSMYRKNLKRVVSG